MVAGETSERVEVADGVSLRVLRRAGDADPPFLLVHGLASNARLWDGVADRLATAGHPSTAVDLRGHGESEKVDRGYDFATLSRDLADVIRATLTPPVVVAGQSWGGNVVLELACRHPELVRGVLCVDGGFIRLASRFADRGEALAALEPPYLEGTSEAELTRRLWSRFPDWPAWTLEARLAGFEPAGDGLRPRLARHRHMRILELLWEHDPDRLAAGVSVPVVVAAVAEGSEEKRRRVATFAAALERGRVVWLEGHHDIHAQRPGEVARLLLDLGRWS